MDEMPTNKDKDNFSTNLTISLVGIVFRENVKDIHFSSKCFVNMHT